jgi:hypothetical protein
MTQIRSFQALVIVNTRATSCSGTSKKGSGNAAIVPTTFEFAKVGFGKQITWITIDRHIPSGILSCMNERGKSNRTPTPTGTGPRISVSDRAAA